MSNSAILKESTNLRYLDTREMSKTEWLKQRKNGIGGSEVASVLNISPYKSAYKVWQDKVSDEIEDEENDYTRLGNFIENFIALEYTRQTGRKTLRDNKIRVHKEHSCLIVNLDRVIVDNQDGSGPGLLECKSTVSYVFKSWKDDETAQQSIPLVYYCQIQHELSVTGYKWAILAVYILDLRKTVFIPIYRDDEYIEKQNRFLVMWWNAYVLQNEAPPMTAVELNFITPDPDSFIEADERITLAFDELLKKEKELKAVEKEVEYLKNQIKEYMGEKERLTIKASVDNKLVDKIAITWKQVIRKSYTVKESIYRQFKIVREI
jgi:putative phage-type endonuclease